MTERETVGPADVASIAIATFVMAMVVSFLLDRASWWIGPVTAVVGGVVGAAVVLLVPVDRPVVSDDSVDGSFVPTITSARILSGPVLQAPPRAVSGASVITSQPAPPLSVRAQRVGSWLTLMSPKVGNDPAMNEDAVAVSEDGRRVAIADGASSAYASGLWARLLVDEATRSSVDLSRSDHRIELVASCGARWMAETDGVSDWWSEEARARGSFAALAGLSFLDGRRWRATAKGDCCVLVLDSSDTIVSSFPIDDSDTFGLTPDLVGVHDPMAEGWRVVEGDVDPHGRVVLATDGFAQWLLQEKGHPARWCSLDPDDWPTELDSLRSSGQMVNDDVAIAILDAKDLQWT